MNALVGHIRLFPILFVVALLPTVLLPLLETPPVYNSNTPSIFLPPIVAAGTFLLIWLLPLPSAVLFSSLLLAGVTANTFHAAIAPVPDYIPLPWSNDHFLNAADIAILGAIFLVPFLLRGLWQKYWN